MSNSNTQCIWSGVTANETTTPKGFLRGIYMLSVYGDMGGGRIRPQVSIDNGVTWQNVYMPIFKGGIYKMAIPSGLVRFVLSEASSPDIGLVMYCVEDAGDSDIVHIGQYQMGSAGVADQKTDITDTASKLVSNVTRPHGPVWLLPVPGETNTIFFGYSGSITDTDDSFPVTGLTPVNIDDVSKIYVVAAVAGPSSVAFHYETIS